ncbi:MAG: DUF1353 domain-containing protein [Methylibium sp.]|nr:DUF1353 domain-containing protein [Methylibium sp.]
MQVKRIDLHSSLVIEPVSGGEWVLREPFQAKVLFADGYSEWIIVPAGFVTDLASVPRLPGMFMLFGGKARKSAVLHDYLYSTGRERAFADDVFLAAMRHEENRFTRGVMWLAVRLAGWTVWRGRPSNGAVMQASPTSSEAGKR